ncbi:helix-turn-helix domain-containing protein [Nitrospira defluvii]|nr:helix-turn-helix domain-containing protein [Nitrospira defluvii]
MYILKKTGHQQKEIAHMLQRDKSTISRELRRNRGHRGYRPKQAHEHAMAWRQAKARPRKKSYLATYRDTHPSGMEPRTDHQQA